jgi:hypothetical protein
MCEAIPAHAEWKLLVADRDEDPDMQTLLFQYPTAFEGNLAYLRPVVKIELGARSDTEPVESPLIKPYIAEQFSGLLGNCDFALRTVAARRTFWEKAMLLHEEAFRPADKQRKPKLSRHYYDLYCLISRGIGGEAAADLDLFERVARHRKVFFRQSWVDYGTLCKGCLRIIPLDEQSADWRRDYEAMRGEMFFDEPPSFDEVLAAVQGFQDEFNR